MASKLLRQILHTPVSRYRTIKEILPLTLQQDYRNKIAKERLLEYQKASKDDIASQNNEIIEKEK